MVQSDILHLVNTLNLGGAERVAVNLVNLLPRDAYQVHLCTTRYDGPLAAEVAVDVNRSSLNRTSKFDVDGVRKLVTYLRTNKISLIHAHETTVFLAALARIASPSTKIIWHAHFGNLNEQFSLSKRLLYSAAVKNVDYIMAVNQPIVDWAQQALKMPADQVGYFPNFVTQGVEKQIDSPLPGIEGERIVCVANFRPQKDHINLVQAMALVIEKRPTAHLLLVGDTSNQEWLKKVQTHIVEMGLEQSISILGRRMDVWSILKMCDIGVLSSRDEGMPLSLIEYGMASLPAIATRVGQCAEVLDEGKVGLLIEPHSPDALAQAMLDLLASPAKRTALGAQFHDYVATHYSAESSIERIKSVYNRLLS